MLQSVTTLESFSQNEQSSSRDMEDTGWVVLHTTDKLTPICKFTRAVHHNTLGSNTVFAATLQRHNFDSVLFRGLRSTSDKLNYDLFILWLNSSTHLWHRLPISEAQSWRTGTCVGLLLVFLTWDVLVTDRHLIPETGRAEGVLFIIIEHL